MGRENGVMAASLHSREEAMELVKSISAAQWREGILIWSPTRERQVRKEKGKRISFREWPPDLAERFVNVTTNLTKRFGTPMGLDVACYRLENAAPHPEEG
jgi:hypothetical protein